MVEGIGVDPGAVLIAGKAFLTFVLPLAWGCWQLYSLRRDRRRDQTGKS